VQAGRVQVINGHSQMIEPRLCPLPLRWPAFRPGVRPAPFHPPPLFAFAAHLLSALFRPWAFCKLTRPARGSGLAFGARFRPEDLLQLLLHSLDLVLDFRGVLFPIRHQLLELGVQILQLPFERLALLLRRARAGAAFVLHLISPLGQLLRLAHSLHGLVGPAPGL
jgi:hypothetical protein